MARTKEQQERNNRNVRTVRERRKQLLRRIKEVPCADCKGQFPYYVMEFDHVPERGKKDIPIRKHCSVKWQLVLDEIAKCDIVCANCHKIRTFKRNPWD